MSLGDEGRTGNAPESGEGQPEIEVPGHSLPVSAPAPDRRRALQLLLSGATVGLSALLSYPLARYLRPLQRKEQSATSSLKADELGLWDAKLIAVGERPVIVVNTGDGFAAVSAICTHLGCVVKWQKGRRQFFCPCHGARFDIAGNVLSGPASAPLAKLTVDEDAETVVVRRV